MGTKSSKESSFIGEQSLSNYSKEFNIDELLIIFRLCFHQTLPNVEFATLSLVSRNWRWLLINTIHSIQLVPETVQHLLLPYKPHVLNNALHCIANVMSTTCFHLTKLDLSNSEIDKHRAHIIGLGIKNNNNTITYLDLHSSCIDDDAAVALSKYLFFNQSIRVLDLSNNSVGDKGAVAIVAALENNYQLEYLDFHDNSIGNNGVIEINDLLIKRQLNSQEYPPNQDNQESRIYQMIKQKSFTSIQLSSYSPPPLSGSSGSGSNYQHSPSNINMISPSWSRSSLSNSYGSSLSSSSSFNELNSPSSSPPLLNISSSPSSTSSSSSSSSTFLNNSGSISSKESTKSKGKIQLNLSKNPMISGNGVLSIIKSRQKYGKSLKTLFIYHGNTGDIKFILK